MKSFRRSAVYRHPVEDVWAALTDPRALAEWLMPVTVFEAKVGATFRFQFDPERLNPTGIADCEILECDPPRHLAWSFSNRSPEGSPQPPPMRIEWTLIPVEGGTRLELVQSYEKQPWAMIFAMGMGWRFYLRRFLPQALKNVSGGAFRPGAIPLARRAYRASNLPGDVIV
jgi:uncharacterized protein YndB with AHSA1/START domain